MKRIILPLIILGMFTIILIVNITEKGLIREVEVAIVDSKVSKDIDDEYLWINKNEMCDGFDNDNNRFVDDIHGWNYITNCPDIFGESMNSHGSICSTLVIDTYTATSKRKSGIKLLPLVIMNDEGVGNIFYLIKAIKYAEDKNIRICCLSLSTEQCSRKLYETIKHSDMLFIISAGNGKSRGMLLDESPIYPASFNLPNCIVVTSLNRRQMIDKKANYSKRIVDVAVNGTYVLDSGEKSSGVSFATARFTGIVASFAYDHPELCSGDIKNEIIERASCSQTLKEKIKNGKYYLSN